MLAGVLPLYDFDSHDHRHRPHIPRAEDGLLMDSICTDASLFAGMALIQCHRHNCATWQSITCVTRRNLGRSFYIYNIRSSSTATRTFLHKQHGSSRST